MMIGLVPDIHGRTFWHILKDKVKELDKIIFLGDYLDPYPNENITVLSAINEFKEVLKFKEEYPDKVILLTGNHDWVYINKEFPDASRKSYEHFGEIHQLFIENIDKFQLIYKTENYLFSHAGVYNDWLNLCKFTLESLENFDKFVSDDWPALTCVSIWRGGYGRVGSCVWADIHEHNNETPKGYKQIVGHTQLKDNVVTYNDVTFIDCRCCFILNTKANTLEKYEIKISYK